MGFDEPDGPPAAGFAESRGLGPYLLYAGRIEEGKRVDVAVEYAVRYAAERPEAPRLVLIGSGTYEVPEEASDVAVYAGFLDEGERRAAYAEALALVNPSHMESLSIVLMEAWLEGTPALVSSGSEVLREHVERSGGGLAFDSYEDFRDAVDRLVERERPARGARQRRARLRARRVRLALGAGLASARRSRRWRREADPPADPGRGAGRRRDRAGIRMAGAPRGVGARGRDRRRARASGRSSDRVHRLDSTGEHCSARAT